MVALTKEVATGACHALGLGLELKPAFVALHRISRLLVSFGRAGIFPFAPPTESPGLAARSTALWLPRNLSDNLRLTEK